MARLLRRETDVVERIDFNPLDRDDDDAPPSVWTGPHVSRRIVEAMMVLRLLPSGGGGGSSAWPVYQYEFDDLVAQRAQYQLELTQKMQNRARVSPSLNEITRMEAAIWWPMRYLRSREHLLKAVNWISFAHSLDRDAGWVVTKLGGYADTWRRNNDAGCEIISDGLIKERELVF
jgi:hypothetical protein